jgi:glycopeptide antibiotics resistance protein
VKRGGPLLIPRALGRDEGVLYIHFGLDGLFALAAGVGTIWLVVCILLRIPLWRAIARAIFAGYVAALLAATLIEYSYGSVGVDSVWRSVNLIPLGTIFELARPEHVHQAVRQLLGNVVMFIPFGVLLPLVAERVRRLGALLVAAALASAGIEVAQLAFGLAGLSGRSVDVDDVILNVIGAAIGYLIWLAGALLIRPSVTKSAFVQANDE